MKPPVVAALMCLVACGSCARRLPVESPPAPPARADAGPPPAAVRVPPGCELNLTGRYRLLGRREVWYRIEDDGAHLVMRPETPADGGAPVDGTLVLDRSPDGFLGSIQATAHAPSGRSCPVAFRAELTACNPGRLTLVSEDEVRLDDRCSLIGSPSAPTEKILVRD